jgi:hypothetical protein
MMRLDKYQEISIHIRMLSSVNLIMMYTIIPLVYSLILLLGLFNSQRMV